MNSTLERKKSHWRIACVLCDLWFRITPLELRFICLKYNRVSLQSRCRYSVAVEFDIAIATLCAWLPNLPCSFIQFSTPAVTNQYSIVYYLLPVYISFPAFYHLQLSRVRCFDDNLGVFNPREYWTIHIVLQFKFKLLREAVSDINDL